MAITSTSGGPTQFAPPAPPRHFRSIGYLGAFAVAVAATLVTTLSGAAAPADSSEARACGVETYSTQGIVKSFGPDRRYVNIAHEKIDGYMMAMTMSFEPRKPDQIAGLREGDKVSFTFAATEDGKRLLNSIQKQ